MWRTLTGVLVWFALAPACAQAAEFGVVQDALRGRQGVDTAQRLRDVGATSVRVVLDWNTIEAERGTRTWAVYDAFFAELRARHVRPLLLVTNTPGWAQDPNDLCLGSSYCPPSAAALPAFGDFVHEAVGRYTDGPHATNPVGLEVWNEQNITTSWKTRTGPDPGRYVEVLRAAAQASRRAVPTLPVVLGGLAPSGTDESRQKMAMEQFLAHVYARGGADLFDVLGIHVYPHPKPGSAVEDAAIDRALSRMRNARDTAGDAATPIWVTETGIADPSEVGGSHTQASLLLATFDRLTTGADVQRVFVFRLRDGPDVAGYGLLTSDLRPRPAFDLLAARFFPAFEAQLPKPAARKKRKLVSCTKAQRKRDLKRPKTKRRCKPVKRPSATHRAAQGA